MKGGGPSLRAGGLQGPTEASGAQMFSAVKPTLRSGALTRAFAEPAAAAAEVVGAAAAAAAEAGASVVAVAAASVVAVAEG